MYLILLFSYTLKYVSLLVFFLTLADSNPIVYNRI